MNNNAFPVLFDFIAGFIGIIVDFSMPKTMIIISILLIR